MVKVKVDVTQVRDGVEYKGKISFGEHNFQYNLHFNIPLGNLDRVIQEHVDRGEKPTNIFNLTVKDSDVKSLIPFNSNLSKVTGSILF